MSIKDKTKAQMGEMKQKWLAIDPTKRRIIIGVVVVLLMLFFAKYLGDKKKAEATEKRQADPSVSTVEKTSMVAPKTGEVGIGDLRGLNQNEIERQRKQQEALFQNQQQIANDYKTGNEAVGQQISDLSKQLASVTDEVKSMRLGRDDSSNGGVNLPPLQGLDQNVANTGNQQQPAPNPYEQPQMPPQTATPDEVIAPRETAPQADPFQVIRSDKKSANFQSNGYRPAGQPKAQNPAVQAQIILKKGLPTGSMLQGVLLNGMDAPTSGRGSSAAVPALVRVKANAVLPNRYAQMVKECFVLVSGVGNLATERADMRGEKISCIFKDGTSIDTTISAYVVGEDGKGGMRGRVVTKQGAAIARSIFAGTLAGLGKQFAPSSVPSLNISGGSQTQYQAPNIGDAGAIAAASGVGNALDRVANFYMDMAEQMVSVVEIDAGRNVTVILTNPMKGIKE